MKIQHCIKAWVLLAAFLSSPLYSQYLIGSGQYDITGPVADVMMMGYVDLNQTTTGISSRLRSRSFVIVDEATGMRVVLLTIDQIHVYEALIQKLVEKLKNKYGSLYTEKNILAQATHTHSAPGGFSHYAMYSNLASMGFSEQNFNVIVEGMFQSIVRAHENLAPGKIRISKGSVEELGVNRSPKAYLLNPPQERAKYNENTDKTMTVLKFERLDGGEVGVIAWFALHATSMKKSNRLISPDNKGYAAYLFEREKGTNYFSKESFVAAFPNTNAGDVSPADGKTLVDNEWTCELKDSFQCTEKAGKKQYLAAKSLYDSAEEELAGPVDYRHRFLDFSKISVKNEFTGHGIHSTCYGAVGISMLAGTEDGRGVGNEGQDCSHPNPVSAPLCLAHYCHGEKPVVIATGLKKPFPWTPQVLPISIVQVGQLALIGVPAEFTTMSGRRTRETLEKILETKGIKYSVLAGYANGYSGYVATPEEYERQDYEGASTHFGQWTLSAYEQELSKLAVALVKEEPVTSDVAPLDLSEAVVDSTPKNPPAYDTVPRGVRFGDMKTAPKSTYEKGNTVAVEFWSSYPNRTLMTQSSFLEVQRKTESGWRTVNYDWDFSTKYIWKDLLGNQGLARIEWQIEKDAGAGTYRILHRAVAQSSSGKLTEFSGVSPEFIVQ